MFRCSGGCTPQFTSDVFARRAYPDVYYPALPGWILGHAQPFSIGVWIVAVGWMVILAVAIGIGATRYAGRRDRSPAVAAGEAVAVLFVVVTAIESNPSDYG